MDDKKYEPYVKNIPKLSNKIGSPTWKQDSPCVHCGREKYNPIFYYGFRQVCKICIGNYSKELKDKFDKVECWF